MYKKLIAAIALVAPMHMAYADPDVGCGLGSQIWEGTSGAIPRSLAATTNGTSGNQTFGVTSGTSGCRNQGAITASARIPVYAKSNLDALAADMASGQGEALNGLASLYGIDKADRQDFFEMSKHHFGEIFTGSDVTSTEVLDRLDTLMRGHPRLSQYTS